MLRRVVASLPWGPGRNGLMTRATLLLGLCELVRTGLYFGFLPQQLAAQGLPLSAAGLAWALHAGADTLLRSPGGHLVERYGLRPVLTATALISLLAVFAIPFAPNTAVLVLLAILHGAALSPIWPAVMTLSSVLAPQETQPRAVALVSVAAGPFTGLGFLGIGWLAGLHFPTNNGSSRLHEIGGWPLAVLLAVQGLAVLLALSLKAARVRPETVSPEPVSSEPVSSDTVSPDTVSSEPPKRQTAPVNLRRTLAFLLPAALVQTLALGLFGQVIRPFASAVGLGQWGLVGLLCAGAGATYSLLGLTGRLTTHHGARPMLVTGLLLAASGLALMATMPPVWLYFVLAALLGVGYACLLPGWGGLVASLLPQQGRAASWGVVMTAENVGMAGGPLLGTLAWDRLGMTAPFLVGAALFVLTASVYLWPNSLWPRARQAT